MKNLAVYVSAVCVLGMLSFIWKENPFYRFMEHIFVGLAAGQAVAAAYTVIKNSCFGPMLKGSLELAVPAVLGLMLYLRYFKQYAWLARVPSSMLLGIGLGAGTSAAIASDVVAQTRATLLPLNSFTNVVLVLGFLATLTYFFFTLFPANSQASSLGRFFGLMARAGRWVMMIFFGAQIGNVTSGRLSMIVAKFQFLLGDVLGILGK